MAYQLCNAALLIGGLCMLIVRDCDLTFESVRHAAFYPKQAHLEEANLLCIPESESSDGGGWCFPEHSIRLIDYMRMIEPVGICFDVAVEEEAFREVQRHDALIDLGKFLLKEVIFSAFINMVSSYIYDWVCPTKKDTDKVELKVEVISQAGGGSKSIFYQGPVSGLSEIASIINGPKSE